MPTTLIYGGHGKVALHLTTLLAKSSPAHKIISVIRNPAHSAEIQSLGAIPLVQSIESSTAEEMAESLRSNGVDTVVWSAGAGGGNPARTDEVDRKGAIKSMDACVLAGVKRYILVSAVDSRDREKAVPSWYNESDRDRSDRVWKAIGAYMAAKFAADKNLVVNNSHRKLDYTIIRPESLGLGEGTGKIEAGKVHFGDGIARKDVARVIVEVLKNQGTIGLAFDIVGGETPIAEAIKKVADEKIDTFEGYY